MALSADALFEKEFNQLAGVLRASATQMGVGAFSLEQFPVPFDFCQVGANAVMVRNVEEPYFDKLNGRVAVFWDKAKPLQRRTFDFMGEFFQNEDGSYKYDQVKVPQGSRAIISSIMIQLPYTETITDKRGETTRKKYKCSEGFDYVDYIDTNAGRRYIYVIPEDYLYMCNRNSLVMTWKNHSGNYFSVKLMTFLGTPIYLQVRPRTKDSQYSTFRVICSKYSNDFNDELQQLTSYWLKNKLIFDKDMCQLEISKPNGVDNLAMQMQKSDLFDYTVYEPYPINHRKEDTEAEDESFTILDADVPDDAFEGGDTE